MESQPINLKVPGVSKLRSISYTRKEGFKQIHSEKNFLPLKNRSSDIPPNTSWLYSLNVILQFWVPFPFVCLASVLFFCARVEKKVEWPRSRTNPKPDRIYICESKSIGNFYWKRERRFHLRDLSDEKPLFLLPFSTIVGWKVFRGLLRSAV